MRINYIASTLFLAGTLGFTGLPCQAQVQTPISSLTWRATQATEQASRAKGEVETIVDEKFDKLTEGSETDYKNHRIDDRATGMIDTELLPVTDPKSTIGWGGYQIFSAGGCIAIGDGGFLNAPTGDYSGNLTMTFRAKLAKGQIITDANGDIVNNPHIEILLARRSEITDFKRVNYNLTEEWQEFTFTATEGEFYDTMIQFFTPLEFTYFVDDVKIWHEINSIQAPIIVDPEVIDNESFVARWQPTSTADEYLLSVYNKVSNPDKFEINEGFEDIVADPDDPDCVLWWGDPNYPQDWLIDVNSNGYKDIFYEEGYKQGKQALCLDDEGDYITTPLSKYPITKGSYWICADDRRMPEGATTNTLLQIDAFNGKVWTPLSQLSLQVALDGYKDGVTVDITEFLKLIPNIVQLRFALVNKTDDDQARIAIDDIWLYGPGTPLNNYFLEDHVVPGRETSSYKVTGLDPNIDYFYSVKARNSEYTSRPSKEWEIYDVSNPTALEPTQVTETSYVANWECGAKSEFFTINNYLSHEAQQDENVVILEENFDAVHSTATPDNPEIKYTTEAESIDQYTNMQGWTATSYCLSEGMIGGKDTSKDPAAHGKQISSILTPVMNLAHNDGEATITVRAWGKRGDWLIVHGNMPSCVFAMEFLQDGLTEMTGIIPTCTDHEQFVIYSNSYGLFMLDYFKLEQPLKKGEKLTILNKTVESNDMDERSVLVDEVKFDKKYDMLYNVTAHRSYHGNQKEVLNSDVSNDIYVYKAETGINDVTLNPTDLQVQGGKGFIKLNLSSANDVLVYDMNGCLVKNESFGAGTSKINLPTGVYVVKLNLSNKQVKVIVH